MCALNPYNPALAELKRKTIWQQEAKIKTYYNLRTRQLPVPPDLKREVEFLLGRVND